MALNIIQSIIYFLHSTTKPTFLTSKLNNLKVFLFHAQLKLPLILAGAFYLLIPRSILLKSHFHLVKPK
jgi:hypothetical protein